MRVSLLVAALLLSLATPALAADEAAAPPTAATSKPQVVRVGILLLSIGNMNVAAGTYTVDFYLSLRSDQELGNLKIEFMNGRAWSTETIFESPTERQFRLQANLMTNIDVRRFPWDVHALPIIVESSNKQDKDMVFVKDEERTGVDEAVVLVGWRFAGFSSDVKQHVYPNYSNESYSQIAFRMHIERLFFISSLKTFFPVLCFLLITFASLIVTVERLDSRIGMNTAMLMASVMFHLSITSQLPPAAYLTIADKAMIAAYLTIGLNLLLSVMMMRFMQIERVDSAKRLRERAFTIVPVFAVLAYVIVAVT